MVCPFSINLPVPLCSTGVTPLQSSYEHSDLHPGVADVVRGPMGEAASDSRNKLTRDGVPCLRRLTFQSFCLQPPPVVSGSICLVPELTICNLVYPVCRRDDGILGFAVN